MNERAWERLGASPALVLANFLIVPIPLQRGIGFMAALFLATTGIAIAPGELARPWLGWFSMLAALLALAGGIAEF
jgi:hypothetical protein